MRHENISKIQERNIFLSRVFSISWIQRIPRKWPDTRDASIESISFPPIYTWSQNRSRCINTLSDRISRNFLYDLSLGDVVDPWKPIDRSLGGFWPDTERPRSFFQA